MTMFALTDAQMPEQELVQNEPQPHDCGQVICKACLHTRHEDPEKA